MAVPPAPTPESVIRLRKLYGSVALTALLSYASFHPLDLGPLAFVALVPVLFLAAQESLKVAAVLAFSSTFLYHVAGLSWIAIVTPEGWLLTSFIEAFYGVALVCIPLWLRRRTGLPLVLTLGALGAGLECIRGNFPFIAFPWLFWGHTQHARSILIQIADVTSVYGLSFIVLTVNAALTETALLLHRRWAAEEDLSPADLRRLRAMIGFPIALLILAFGYGVFRLRVVRTAMAKDPGPRVLVVQSDLPQSLKDSEKRTTVFQLAEMNLGLTRAVLEWNRNEPFDAIVWSETMWPWPIPDTRTAASKNGYDRWLEGIQKKSRRYAWRVERFRQQLFDIARRSNRPLYVGVVDRGFASGEEHNSYYCIVPDRTEGAKVSDRYDKVMLVPVSEYIPFKNVALLRWFYDFFKALVPPGFTVFTPGTGPKLFPAGKYTLAPNICFEISFPELLRRSTLEGASAHICPANDAWFVRGFLGEQAKATAEVPLAKAHSVFRAIENRRPIIRCVNRGISLVVDPTGEIVSQVEKTGKDGQPVRVGVASYAAFQAPTTDLRSFYVRFGNVFPILCLLAMVVLGWFGWQGKTLVEPTEGIKPGEPASPEEDSDSAGSTPAAEEE